MAAGTVVSRELPRESRASGFVFYGGRLSPCVTIAMEMPICADRLPDGTIHGIERRFFSTKIVVGLQTIEESQEERYFFYDRGVRTKRTIVRKGNVYSERDGSRELFKLFADDQGNVASIEFYNYSYSADCRLLRAPFLTLEGEHLPYKTVRHFLYR